MADAAMDYDWVFLMKDKSLLVDIIDRFLERHKRTEGYRAVCIDRGKELA